MNEDKYGSIDFEGKTYILLDQAEMTGRQILDWQTEEGFAHFSSPAVDIEGNDYSVEWILQIPEGCEDLSELDWDNVDQVV